MYPPYYMRIDSYVCPSGSHLLTFAVTGYHRKGKALMLAIQNFQLEKKTWLSTLMANVRLVRQMAKINDCESSDLTCYDYYWLAAFVICNSVLPFQG
ncbi:hypothetical protein M514_25732 [Trichuris suis]|uniref:Uncharacterized protein n=1 Tax=Trichuris suis TaxID=68888 RepID=A0A085MY34_9BILA|nr:hypothetical protein M514_25732 [Trichuris suis]